MCEFSHPSMMNTLQVKQPLTVEHVEQWHLVWCWLLLHCDIMDISYWGQHTYWAVNSNTITSRFLKSGILMGGVGWGSHFSRWGTKIFKNHQLSVLHHLFWNRACRSFCKARKSKLKINSLYKVLYKILIFNPEYLLNERSFKIHFFSKINVQNLH